LRKITLYPKKPKKLKYGDKIFSTFLGFGFASVLIYFAHTLVGIGCLCVIKKLGVLCVKFRKIFLPWAYFEGLFSVGIDFCIFFARTYQIINTI
jgi:hypothetical protein